MPDLETKTLEAINRYSQAWMKNAEQEIRKIRYSYTRTLIVAVIVSLFMLLLLGIWLEQYQPLWVQVIAQGLYIFVWVLLWWPLDQLIFGYWENRLERLTYQALQNIYRSIQPECLG